MLHIIKIVLENSLNFLTLNYHTLKESQKERASTPRGVKVTPWSVGRKQQTVHLRMSIGILSFKFDLLYFI